MVSERSHNRKVVGLIGVLFYLTDVTQGTEVGVSKLAYALRKACLASACLRQAVKASFDTPSC
jgi:hypothetical protein